MQRWRKEQGFTLLELLVALAIFATLSAMAYSGLRIVLDSKQRNEAQAARLIELQTALTFLQRDIEQAIGRSTRDGFGDVQPALRADGFGVRLLELTRAGLRNPTGIPRSALQRIAYRFEDDSLLRQSWQALDQPGASEPQQRLLLTRVKAVDFRYLDDRLQWQGQWPPSGVDVSPVMLPRAVEVKLELDDMGTVTRLMRIAPGEAIVPQTFATS